MVDVISFRLDSKVPEMTSYDPSNPPSTANTPDSTVYVYDFDLSINKYTVKSGVNTLVSGAKSVLYREEGEPPMSAAS